MEQNECRWHKMGVDGTKWVSMEQKECHLGTFGVSVPSHPGTTAMANLCSTNKWNEFDKSVVYLSKINCVKGPQYKLSKPILKMENNISLQQR